MCHIFQSLCLVEYFWKVGVTYSICGQTCGWQVKCVISICEVSVIYKVLYKSTSLVL